MGRVRGSNLDQPTQIELTTPRSRVHSSIWTCFDGSTPATAVGSIFFGLMPKGHQSHQPQFLLQDSRIQRAVFESIVAPCVGAITVRDHGAGRPTPKTPEVETFFRRCLSFANRLGKQTARGNGDAKRSAQRILN